MYLSRVNWHGDQPVLVMPQGPRGIGPGMKRFLRAWGVSVFLTLALPWAAWAKRHRLEACVTFPGSGSDFRAQTVSPSPAQRDTGFQPVLRRQ